MGGAVDSLEGQGTAETRTNQRAGQSSSGSILTRASAFCTWDSAIPVLYMDQGMRDKNSSRKGPGGPGQWQTE